MRLLAVTLAGWIGCCASWAQTAAAPLTPAAALRLASGYEAQFQAAQAQFRAEREAVPMARGGLLPEVSLNAARNSNQLDARLGPAQQPRLDYYSNQASLTLRQPLWRPEQWARLRQADAEVGRQQLLLDTEQQRLAGDVAAQYLEVLRAEADLRARRAEVDLLEAQAAASARGASLGLASANERELRRSRAALASLHVLDAAGRQAEAVSALERTIGEPVRVLLAPAADPPDDPGPPRDEWVQRARAASPELAAAMKGVEVAREALARSQAAAQPTLDLVAARTYESSATFSAINNTYQNTSVGLQVSIPLYSGGRQSAEVRQGVALLEKAQAQADATARALDARVEREVLQLAQARQRLAVHRAAVAAQGQQLQAARQGNARGVQSPLDVAEAQTQLAAAESEQAIARLQLLAAQVRLRLLAGDAAWRELDALERWLSEPVAVTR